MTHFRLALGAHLWQDPSTSSLWGPPPASRGFVQHLAYHLRVGLSDQHKTASVMVREDTLTPTLSYSVMCSGPALFQGEEYVSHFSPPIHPLLIFQSMCKSPQTLSETPPLTAISSP